jgi:hypothetical protein
LRSASRVALVIWCGAWPRTRTGASPRGPRPWSGWRGRHRSGRHRSSRARPVGLPVGNLSGGVPGSLVGHSVALWRRARETMTPGL